MSENPVKRIRMATQQEADSRAQVALWRAIADRCTCEDRDPALGPLEGHQADCSLQNTGWLS